MMTTATLTPSSPSTKKRSKVHRGERFVSLVGDDGQVTVNVRYVVMVYRMSDGRASVRVDGREKLIYTYQQYDEVSRLVQGASG